VITEKALLQHHIFHQCFVVIGMSFTLRQLSKQSCSANLLNYVVPALKWGQEYEEIARKDYIAQTESEHVNFSIRSCGLVIYPSFPYLGAGPDIVIFCDCCGTRLLEIKCSYKYQNESPTSTISLADANYCLKKNGNGDICFSVNRLACIMTRCKDR
jgi:hypothetical protein